MVLVRKGQVNGISGFAMRIQVMSVAKPLEVATVTYFLLEPLMPRYKLRNTFDIRDILLPDGPQLRGL